MSLGECILSFLSRPPSQDAQEVVREKPRGAHALWILERVYPQLSELVSGKRVVDFGCGVGGQSLALAEQFSSDVLGIDTNIATLARAKEAASAQELASGSVAFVEIAKDQHRGQYDVVISQNSFEHFPDPAFILEEMRSLLAPDGVILITFGPPWYAPFGSHMQFFCKLPWLNLLFSEKTIMSVRANYRDDGATRFEDVESGLNRMSIGKFESLIAACGLAAVEKKYECVKGLNFLGRLPVLRELFINHVTVVLRQPIA